MTHVKCRQSFPLANQKIQSYPELHLSIAYSHQIAPVLYGTLTKPARNRHVVNSMMQLLPADNPRNCLGLQKNLLMALSSQYIPTPTSQGFVGQGHKSVINVQK